LQAPRDQRLQALGVAVGASDELIGLLVSGDKPGARQHGGERLTILRYGHSRHWSRSDNGLAGLTRD